MPLQMMAGVEREGGGGYVGKVGRVGIRRMSWTEKGGGGTGGRRGWRFER